MARNPHFELPKALSGYELRPRRSELEIVIPEATTNLVVNPGFELSTANWTAGGGTLARVTGDVWRGAYCGRYTPAATAGDGFYYGTLALTAGQNYAVSIRFKGAAGQRYRLAFGDTVGGILAQTRFVATGRWQSVWVAWRETATNSRRIYVAKDTSSTSTQPFYVDDVQVENKAYPTTYCDGDMKGFVRGRADYTWSGRPHMSTSSRSSTCAHGGRVVNISKFGFRVLAVVGLGFGFVSNRATPLATGGAIYQNTLQTERQWTVAGLIDGKSQDIRRARGDLAAALHANRLGIHQPVMLRYTPIERGAPAGDALELPSLYESGLQVNLDNDNQSQVTLAFSLYLPYLSAGRGQSTAIPYQAVLGDEQNLGTSSLLARTAEGEYGVALYNSRAPAVFNPVDGKIYMHQGTPQTWDLSTNTRVTLAGSNFFLASTVRAIVVMPNGDVWYAGDAQIQRYRLATGTWDAAIAANGVVNDLAYSPVNGRLAVGGAFTTFDGTAVNRVATSTNEGDTWSALGSGSDNTVRVVAWGLDGDRLYIGGDFTTFAGNTSQRLAVWSIRSGTNLILSSTIFSGHVAAIAIGIDGTPYVGGNLGVSSPDPAVVQLLPTNQAARAGFATTTGAIATGLSAGPNGELYVRLSAGSIEGIDAWPNQTALYVVKGGTVRLFDLPAGADKRPIDFNTRGDVVVSGSETTMTPAAMQILVNNESSTDSWPTLIVDGPGSLRRLSNETLGLQIDMDLDIAYGERVFFEFAPDGVRLYSTSRPNLVWAILPGSNLSGMRLAPGANRLRLLMHSEPIVTGGVGQWTAYVFGNLTAANSDSGKLYMSVVDVGGGLRTVRIYSDSARTQMVAQSGNQATGVFVLVSANGSGLSGYVTTAASPPTATATLALQFGLAHLIWPVVHDSVDAAVE